MLMLIFGTGQYTFPVAGGTVLPYEPADSFYRHYSVARDVFYCPVASIFVPLDSIPSQDAWRYTIEPWPSWVASGLIPIAQIIVIVKPDNSKYTVVRYRWRSNDQWNDDTKSLVTYWFATECLKEISKGNKEAMRAFEEFIMEGVGDLADSTGMSIVFYLEAGLEARIMEWGQWDSRAYRWNIRMLQEHPTVLFRDCLRYLLSFKDSTPQDTLP